MESTYLECLQSEFADRKIQFERQRAVPIVYKGKRLRTIYRIDLVIENFVVVESEDPRFPRCPRVILVILAVPSVCPVP